MIILTKKLIDMEAPRLNEIWQIQWGEAVGKEHNALVRIDEDKKELKPPNWRCNQYKCEHKGSELIVGGDRFIERWATADV
jgi:hypothetical protein